MFITLNGEPYELEAPMSIIDLLTKLDIDPRRVAIEHNLIVIKRERYDSTVVADGDSVEVVRFVGGGLGELANFRSPIADCGFFDIVD